MRKADDKLKIEVWNYNHHSIHSNLNVQTHELIIYFQFPTTRELKVSINVLLENVTVLLGVTAFTGEKMLS